MATDTITVIEIIGSGASSQTPRHGEFEKKYRIIGTSDDKQARTKLMATAPATYEGLPVGQIQVRPVDYHVFEATVSYTNREFERQHGTFSFNTLGGTTHINHSLQTVSSTGLNNRTALDFQGGINVDGDEVKGLDVTIPSLEFTETHKFPPATVNTTFVRTIMNITGTVNSNEFRGFAAGEVLFKGATGSYNDSLVAVTYHYSCSANRKIVVAGTEVSKDGWDYMWIDYEKYEDTSTNEVATRPRAVYIERIYPRLDFTTLALSTQVVSADQGQDLGAPTQGQNTGE